MALNPVERQLLELCYHWDSFRTNASKRLLIWQAPDDAVRLLHCFLEVQKHETEYSTGDLFVVFDSPFDNSIQYSRALKESLAGQYDASRDDLQQQGIATDWKLSPQDFPDSATGFAQSLSAFASHYSNAIEHVVAVLLPSNVSEQDAFLSWLCRALATDVHKYVRLLTVDSVESPRLTQLVVIENPLIQVDKLDIDTLTVAQETFAEEGGVGPAAVFRNLLIGLMTLVEKSSVDQVKDKVFDAVQFARKQQWIDQEVVVAMLYAGALLKEKRFDDAIKVYHSARQTAMQAEASGHPAGQELVLQTWFGEAGVQLAAGNTLKAADCYDQAAIVAQRIPNHILAIEAFRMGAFCFARLDDRDAATARGYLTLTLGERLEAEERRNTTLPIAAIDLLRLIEPERVERLEEIKRLKDARQKNARVVAEQHAAEAAETADAQALRNIEAHLAADMANAEQAAARELDGLVASGSEQFRQSFARVRSLLGEQWPLAKSVSIAGAPDTTQRAAS